MLSAPLALVALAVLAFSTLALLLIALSLPPPPANLEPGDLDTYSRVVERLRAGEPYHEALGAELRADGRGTLSVFNWRPPAFMSWLALLPSLAIAQAVLVGVVAIAFVFALRLGAEGRSQPTGAALAVLLAASLIAAFAPTAPLMCELLAGALILLSASAYGLERRWIGFAAAALSLFVRELAALYVLVCILAAWRERRFRELAGWAIVLAAFAAYYLWHAAMVRSLLGPDDHAHPEGWLQFGGAAFALLAASFNGIFLILPYWASALLLPFAVLGLAGWRHAGAMRILMTVLAYLVLFAIFGRPANSYWGALFTPLLALGVIHAPAALRDLVAAARPMPRTA